MVAGIHPRCSCTPSEVLKGRSVERGGPPADRSNVGPDQGVRRLASLGRYERTRARRRTHESESCRAPWGRQHRHHHACPESRGLHSGAGRRIRDTDDRLGRPRQPWRSGRGSDRDPPSEEFAPVRVCCPQNVHDGSVWATTRSAHLASDHTGGFFPAPLASSRWTSASTNPRRARRCSAHVVRHLDSRSGPAAQPRALRAGSRRTDRRDRESAVRRGSIQP